MKHPGQLTGAKASQIFNAINMGLVLIDASERILMWNDWMVKHSMINAKTALQKTISDVFSDKPSAAFLTSLRNTIQYGLPAVLSNALHRSPLPLFNPGELSEESGRMHQSITITPLPAGPDETHCLIQIMDSSASIKREKILRSHSEIFRKEATTDSLTGIYNRRFFDEHFKMAMGHSRRQQLPLSVFMVDIDFFKEYNDYYGHVAGDKALISVAKTLKSQLTRASDIVARYGGEEFILMLPNMPEELAMQFAERLRAAVWESAIPHLKSRISEQISISIGISTYLLGQDVTIQHLLEAADTALYKAKQNGRNSCCYLNAQSIIDLAGVDKS
ncbi:GGDEF domain-containing protein [Undibacterium sp. Jales W-56]|uniref:sensor domain-containing diguanylate cyclase n=1 Tax=Undibacterium sp. Jales W-56 TaxID=2897325 RepID=UPI0021CEE57A|nr:GGDEF domain-containing protein [Undibacterium sp. Jales W-56]MCU6435504.1 GGDEF domain-containing protein [Undibacterium sp. Jales W-56]